MPQQQVLGLYSRLKEREDKGSDYAISPFPFEELYLENSPHGFQLYLLHIMSVIAREAALSLLILPLPKNQLCSKDNENEYGMDIQ